MQSGEQEQPPRLQRYRLFIDESGDHTFRKLDDPSHRYLGLLGVWFRWQPKRQEQLTGYWKFAKELHDLKSELFDSPNVILHREEIIGYHGVFKRLRDPRIFEKFNERLGKVITRADFVMACVVIDKQAYASEHGPVIHPYHACLNGILDSYCGWLNHENAQGDVVAEARRSSENQRLRAAFRALYEGGTPRLSRWKIQRALTTGRIEIVSKTANFGGLQLADLLANPIKKTLLIEKQRLPAGSISPSEQRWVEAAAPKFHCYDPGGGLKPITWGHGKKIV